MADRFTFFRWMAHEIARKHGAFASFMPKVSASRTGSGAHFNMSLADPRSGENLFEDPGDPRGCGLSKLGYQFIAGVLRHARAICAVAAPLVNSYKRLVLKGSMSGFTWAPVYVCYGGNNRTNMLRIPMGGGPGRVPDAGHRLQPLPGLRHDARGRAWRGSARRSTRAPPTWRTCTSTPRPTSSARGSRSCRGRCWRRSRRSPPIP